MTKYSIKNICLGIGIGMVLASMANISTAPKSLTEDQIRREAAKHNLIVMEAKDLIKKQPEQPQPQAPAKPEAPKQQQTVVIVINSGISSEEIAELLFSNKLIESKQAFLNRLTELKKESKVQIGTFKIESGSSIDKIIETITSSPK